MLKKYEDATFDTLKVYSGDDLGSESYPFRGRLLDRDDIRLFPSEFVQQLEYDSGFFACYKFHLDSSRYGLITRTPSEYEPSSIKLFVLDKKKGVITYYYELAESIGDAGDVSNRTSWLFRQPNGFGCFTWDEELHYNSVENENDTSIQRWDYFRLASFNKRSVDTFHLDEGKAKRQFGHFLTR
ncbi:hypothetical protein GCM10023184_03870 [Flaviaesturariibacter amylovorans]|uniref:Uncharacterized protein n=1 Tax=Flaviaesturariibacter amylovorans TaxID=1084520 RepID=A0ABP8G8L3_9BACT